MPKVTVQYEDTTSLTIEEIVKQAEANYGKLTTVEVTSSSQLPHDQLYWAIQQIITRQQISLLFDRTGSYNNDIKKLKLEVVKDITEIVDQVILDNEAKVEAL